MEIRSHYNAELKSIFDYVVQMGDMVIESLYLGLDSLLNQDEVLAKKVIESDKIIDALELKIEDKCTMLIAMENPVATELREVLTVIKIISELERLGDHGKHLAKRAGKVSREGLKIAEPYLKDMTNFGCQMVKESLESFIQLDQKWAEEIASRDNYIDDKYKLLYEKLIEIIKTKPNKAENLVPLLFLNRYLERIGDRVTNICESIVYVITCKHKSL